MTRRAFAWIGAFQRNFIGYKRIGHVTDVLWCGAASPGESSASHGAVEELHSVRTASVFARLSPFLVFAAFAGCDCGETVAPIDHTPPLPHEDKTHRVLTYVGDNPLEQIGRAHV